VDKSGDRIRAMFAGIAPRYDLLNHLLSLNIDRWWRSFTVRKLDPKPGEPILDCCTGTGDLAIGLATKVGPDTEVIGADFTPEMLDIARKKAAQSHPRIQWIEADTMALPFESDRFALVSVAFGLRNVSDTAKGLAEMIRVTRPGGKIAILEFSKPRVPPFGWLYLAYFKYLLPRIGQAVSRSDNSAYHYLPKSVLQFPDGEAMEELLRGRGLTSVERFPLTLGIATLYIGVKPAA
jgi:demethylmenaquinone methyltransferase/2-methoxy-6-polyprenyl-1,4-benzoquinol methylase